MAGNFEGHDPRSCGEHRTTGDRAWCFTCLEWCYPGDGCVGCKCPDGVEAALEELAQARRQLGRVKNLAERWTSATIFGEQPSIITKAMAAEVFRALAIHRTDLQS